MDAFMTNNVRKLQPRIPGTEKITINLGYVIWVRSI